MKTIDRAACKQLSADVIAALKDVALKHGVQFTYKGGNFCPTSLTLRLEAAVVGDAGVAETTERRTYRNYAQMFDLKPEWLDQTFMNGSEKYQIVGLNTRRSKNPVLCKNLGNGKTYIYPPHTVKMLMNIQGVKLNSPVAD